ncbi:MAG: flagellar biosynthesis protein FlhF [Methylococcales bacterium]|nr:flagellar biosynthesis protein FlhF [Methylococcales bacterium]
MKIKRFFAEDIRQVMRMVKEELGSDAVILSNRSVDGGVEIVAARDFDEQALQQETPPVSASQKTARSPLDSALPSQHVISNPRKKNAEGVAPPRSRRAQGVDQYIGYAEKLTLGRQRAEELAQAYPKPNTQAQDGDSLEQALSHAVNAPRQAQAMAKTMAASTRNVAVDSKKASDASAQESMIKEMFEELKSLRMTMNSRLSEFGWRQSIHNNPVRIELLQRLTDMGFAKALSLKVANRLQNYEQIDPAFRKAQSMLTNVLPIAEDSLLEHGGIAVLVGPTGVGKTTTIAKLAARFILQHGPKQVALITTDNYRIAAHEQLNTYARILDIPVRVATDGEHLRELLHSFSDKRLVLIDTAGMSQRDQRLAEQIETLAHRDFPIKFYLVMSAAAHYKSLKETVQAFSIFQPEAAILTKMDEAAAKGAGLSVLMEQRLPLAFVTDGQQVPEDLHEANADTLVKQCVAELPEGFTGEAALDYDDWVAHQYA